MDLYRAMPDKGNDEDVPTHNTSHNNFTFTSTGVRFGCLIVNASMGRLQGTAGPLDVLEMDLGADELGAALTVVAENLRVTGLVCPHLRQIP